MHANTVTTSIRKLSPVVSAAACIGVGHNLAHSAHRASGKRSRGVGHRDTLAHVDVRRGSHEDRVRTPLEANLHRKTRCRHGAALDCSVRCCCLRLRRCMSRWRWPPMRTSTTPSVHHNERDGRMGDVVGYRICECRTRHHDGRADNGSSANTDFLQRISTIHNSAFRW